MKQKMMGLEAEVKEAREGAEMVTKVYEQIAGQIEKNRIELALNKARIKELEDVEIENLKKELDRQSNFYEEARKDNQALRDQLLRLFFI